MEDKQVEEGDGVKSKRPRDQEKNRTDVDESTRDGKTGKEKRKNKTAGVSKGTEKPLRKDSYDNNICPRTGMY